MATDRVTIKLYANTGRKYNDQVVFDYSTLANKATHFNSKFTVTISSAMIVKGVDNIRFQIKLDMLAAYIGEGDRGLHQFDYLRIENNLVTRAGTYQDGHLYAYIDSVSYENDKMATLNCIVDVIETYCAVNMNRIFTRQTSIDREHTYRFTNAGGYLIDRHDENIVAPKYTKSKTVIANSSGIFNIIKGVNIVFMKNFVGASIKDDIIAVVMIVLSQPFPIGGGSVFNIENTIAPDDPVLYWWPGMKNDTVFTDRYITAIDGGDPMKYFSAITESGGTIYVTPRTQFNRNSLYDGGTLGTFQYIHTDPLTLEEAVSITTAVSLTASRPITPTPPATNTTARSINHETKLLNSQFFTMDFHLGATVFTLPYERIDVTTTINFKDTMLLNMGNANIAEFLTGTTPITIELSDHDYFNKIPYIKNRQVPDITDEFVQMVKDKSVQRIGNLTGTGIAIGGAVVGALFGIATGNPIAITGSIVALLGAVTNLGRQAVMAGVENQRMRETAQLTINQMDDATLDRVMNQSLPYVTTAWPSDQWLSLLENIFYTIGYNANGEMRKPNVRSRYHFNFLKANTGSLLIDNISPIHYNEIKKRFADGLLIVHAENVASIPGTVSEQLDTIFTYGNKEVF